MALTQTVSDSMTQTEAALLQFNYLKTISDTANTYSDAITRIILGYSYSQFEDRFLLTDEIKAQFHYRLAQSDVLTLSDAIVATFHFLLTQADQISMNDAIVKSQASNIEISVGDNANSFSDALGNGGSPFTSDSLVNYLRRYLGDVPR